MVSTNYYTRVKYCRYVLQYFFNSYLVSPRCRTRRTWTQSVDDCVVHDFNKQSRDRANVHQPRAAGEFEEFGVAPDLAARAVVQSTVLGRHGQGGGRPH